MVDGGVDMAEAVNKSAEEMYEKLLKEQEEKKQENKQQKQENNHSEQQPDSGRQQQNTPQPQENNHRSRKTQKEKKANRPDMTIMRFGKKPLSGKKNKDNSKKTAGNKKRILRRPSKRNRDKTFWTN